jgi:hypothetical protein
MACIRLYFGCDSVEFLAACELPAKTEAECFDTTVGNNCKSTCRSNRKNFTPERYGDCERDGLQQLIEID